MATGGHGQDKPKVKVSSKGPNLGQGKSQGLTQSRTPRPDQKSDLDCLSDSLLKLYKQSSDTSSFLDKPLGDFPTPFDIESLFKMDARKKLSRDTQAQSTPRKVNVKREVRTSEDYEGARPKVDPVASNLQDELRLANKKLCETQMELTTVKIELDKQREEFRDIKRRNVPEKIMPMKYSGNTDFEEYMAQFEAISSMYQWDSHRKAVILLSKLQDQALSVATAEGDKSFEGLVAKLRSTFCPEQQEVYALKLNSRVQGKDESYATLAHEITKLVKKAYSSTDQITRDRLAKDAFVNAITDDSVREKLRDRNPVTVIQALKEVQQIAAHFEMEKHRTKIFQPVRTVEKKTADADKIRYLEEKLEKLQTDLDKYKHDGEKQSDSSRNKGRKELKCFHCKYPGHIKRKCPFLTAGIPVPNQSEDGASCQGNSLGQR